MPGQLLKTEGPSTQRLLLTRDTFDTFDSEHSEFHQCTPTIITRQSAIFKSITACLMFYVGSGKFSKELVAASRIQDHIVD